MEKIKTFYKKYLHTCIGVSLLLAFLLNLAIEGLARKSFAGGLEYLYSHPLVFIYNMMIIFATLSLVLMFRRRIFVLIIISALWLTLGIVNGIILLKRMTPFTTKDLSVLEDGLSIVTNYLSKTEIGFAIAAIVISIAMLVLLFFFVPKKKVQINYKRNAAILLAITLAMVGMSNLAIKTHVVGTFFGNLAYAYRDYGVPYCFLSTWLNTGVGMPSNYSKEAVLSLFEKGELGDDGIAAVSSGDDGGAYPNIIMLQLESFIDPLLVQTIELSEDPIPYFRQLMENYSSGYLTVPSVGAGTANTEFEVLSGMSVKFFGPGEYPYKSILKEQTCETIAYNLKSIGFDTHAIHNHRGAFYGRNKVYPNLGFDTFTSLEYMNYVVRTPANWAKDSVLTEQIMNALQSSERQDFICTVSVQGHGKYPTEQILQDPKITVTDAPTEEMKWQYEYYVNQMREMDDFIEKLTKSLSEYDEDVVLVMYGDHLPALDMTEDDMANGSLYQTEYVIWSNFKMQKKDQDLCAYELSAEVLDQLGIHVGVMTKYHQNHNDSPTYEEDMHMLEYDMLYGKQYVYGGINPFEPTKMKMGINNIKINTIAQVGEKLYLKGENFTPFSKISLDGKILKTTYVGPSLLELRETINPDDVSRMKISQVEKNKEILSTTE